jgi:hypothetical protein
MKEVVPVHLVGVMAVAKFAVSALIKKLLLTIKMYVRYVILFLSVAKLRLAGFLVPVRITSAN